MHSTSNLGNILKEKEKKDLHYLRSPYIPSFNFRAEPSTNENIWLCRVKLQHADPKFIFAANYLLP